jgi:hypothetical protein
MKKNRKSTSKSNQQVVVSTEITNSRGLTEVINLSSGQRAFVDASKYKTIYR